MYVNTECVVIDIGGSSKFGDVTSILKTGEFQFKVSESETAW